MKYFWVPLLLAVALPFSAAATGNTSNDSFADAKRMLERQVYFDHRETLYCGAEFDAQKRVPGERDIQNTLNGF